MAFTNTRGRTETSLSEINVTPFVDVVLVLLIIFMITAPVMQTSIEVELPQTKTVRSTSEQLVVITIDREQRIYVGNDPVNIRRLGDVVKERTFGLLSQPIYLRLDKTVPYETLALVLDHLKQAGFENAQLMTELYDSRTKR